MQKLILILCCFLFFSCSVQKRHYQKGFYFSYAHQLKHHNSNKSNDLNHLGYNKANQNPIVSDIPDSEDGTPQLSVQKSVLKIMPNDSCDVIIFKDGSETSAKVTEISPGQIQYKRCDLLNGPLYTVKKSEVFMVKYANGVREVFKEETPPVQATNTVQVPHNYQIPNKNINKPEMLNQKVHPSAVWAFVWGLISLLAFFLISSTGSIWLLLLSITSAIRAISSSIKAIRQINNYPADFKGKGLAMTGRVFGIVILSLLLLVIIVVLSTI